MKLSLWLKREWLAFRSWHILVVLTLTLGLGGVFLIEQLKDSFLGALRSEERELLSSDLGLRARRPLTQAEKDTFIKLAGTNLLQHYMVQDMSSMMMVGDKTQLVELKVVEEGFPFYGKIETSKGALRIEEGDPLLADNCVYLLTDTASLLGIPEGTSLRIGEKDFRYCRTITKDPTMGFRGFSLAPRVYFGASHLEASGLSGNGTISTHVMHLRLKRPLSDEEFVSWKKIFQDTFKDNGLRLQRPQDTSEQIARAGQMFADYLQLSSLIALLLAVVGLFYLFRSMMSRRAKDMAVLRALGLGRARVRWLIVWPLICDFILAAPLAFLFSKLAFPFLTHALGKLFLVEFAPTSFPLGLLAFMPLSLVVVLAALMPTIEEILSLPVTALIQGQQGISLVSWRRNMIWPIVGFTGFASLAVLAANSWKVGIFFSLALVVAVGFLALMTAVLGKLSGLLLVQGHRFRYPLGLVMGLALRRLVRRPMNTLVFILALGLGSVLLSLLGHLELSLSKEFSQNTSRPSLFLFDIQDDQVQGLKDFMQKEHTELEALMPMVRGRLLKVNGESFKNEVEEQSFRTRESQNEERMRTRAMNLSWAQGLNSSETLVEGVPFNQVKLPEGVFPLSLEERFAQRLGIELHDKLEFDILGVPVSGEVVNIRSVKWTSFRPNFFIVFGPGALEEAPKSWLASTTNLDAAKKAQLQNALVKTFPNISALDISVVVEKIMQLFVKLKSALELMALFVMAVGVVVVASMARDQILRRQSEVMLEKILGLTPGQVVLGLISELTLLVWIAFLGGALTGAAMAALLMRELFEGPMVWSLGLLLSLPLWGTLLVIVMAIPLARQIFWWRPSGLLKPN